MKKVTSVLVALILLCSCFSAMAEDTVKVESSLFSFELPSDWTFSVDETKKEDLFFFQSVWIPVDIYASSSEYSLLIHVYELPAYEQSYVDKANDKIKAGDTVLLSLSGMTNDVKSSERVQFEGDKRTFVISALTNGAYLATYYNSTTKWAYVFYLSHQNRGESVPADTLPSILRTLTEVGYDHVFDPNALQVVITNQSANVRAGSNASAAKIATATKGDSFPYLGEENGWYKIDVNGQVGYVSQGLATIK